MHNHTQSCTVIHRHAQSGTIVLLPQVCACVRACVRACVCVCVCVCECECESVCVLQDTSTGQIIAQHRTKMGPCDVLRHNPYNAVSLLGHAQGVVTMWTPNMTSPAVKMLAHRVSCLAYNYAPAQSLCAVPAHYVNRCTAHLIRLRAVAVLLVLVHLGFPLCHGS